MFGTDQPDLNRFRSIPLRDGQRRVLMYKQRMDGLDVVGSSLRILTRGESPAQVVYVAGRVAIRPEGGLPEPTVTPAEAIAAAQAHPLGRELGPWSEPELVAAFDDVPNGDGVAYPAWKVSGAGNIETARTFFIHAVTGRVARHGPSVMGLADITGVSEGHATPGLKPNTWGSTTSCPNDAVEIGLSNVLIEAFDGMTLVDSAYTDANGDYTLDVPGSTTVDLFAHLGGEAAELYEDTFLNWPAAWGSPLDPLEEPGVMAPNTQNFNFNPSPPTDFGTSSVNVHVHMTKTWEYLAPTYSIPPAPIIVNDPWIGTGYWPAGSVIGAVPPITNEPSDPAPSPGRITLFGGSNSSTLDLAYSTVITHEYGHFWLFMVPEINPLDGGPIGFHEGFSDTLAHLVHSTTLIGEDYQGCGTEIRDPVAANITYPNCGSQWTRGMLLSKIWLNMLLEFEGLYGTPETAYTKVKAIHLGWMLLAQPSGPDSTFCTALDQSASEEALIEVLVIDSPTDDPSDAPHLAEICAAFDLQDIQDPAVCEEAAGNSCYADCDASKSLNVFDFLCFQEKFVSGDRYADCDGDGRMSMFDFLCFQDDFTVGCP